MADADNRPPHPIAVTLTFDSGPIYVQRAAWRGCRRDVVAATVANEEDFGGGHSHGRFGPAPGVAFALAEKDTVARPPQ